MTRHYFTANMNTDRQKRQGLFNQWSSSTGINAAAALASDFQSTSSWCCTELLEKKQRLGKRTCFINSGRGMQKRGSRLTAYSLERGGVKANWWLGRESSHSNLTGHHLEDKEGWGIDWTKVGARQYLLNDTYSAFQCKADEPVWLSCKPVAAHTCHGPSILSLKKEGKPNALR